MEEGGQDGHKKRVDKMDIKTNQHTNMFQIFEIFSDLLMEGFWFK